MLSLDLSPSVPRNLPLLVCLRQDAERSLPADRRAAILEALCSFASGTMVTDTGVPGPHISFPEYEQHLDTLWADFARARCVVTDRLHGLIFSVISRTPCVVIENSNHKIRSTFETWLTGSPSIRLLTEPTHTAVKFAIEHVLNTVAPQTRLNGAFAPLAVALRG